MNAGHELAGAERLRHVVVRANGEPYEQVGFGITRGEHEYGDRAITLDLFAHLDAVETGKHEVEHDEIRTEAITQVDATRPVAGDLHLVTLAPQTGHDRGGDRHLVLDHRDPAAGRRRACRAHRGRGSAGHAPEDKDQA